MAFVRLKAITGIGCLFIVLSQMLFCGPTMHWCNLINWYMIQFCCVCSRLILPWWNQWRTHQQEWSWSWNRSVSWRASRQRELMIRQELAERYRQLHIELIVFHISKFSFENQLRKPLSKENFQMWHTHLRKFLLMKVNGTSSIPESFLLQTVSCDWPVRNTWRYWLEFHGRNTVHNN